MVGRLIGFFPLATSFALNASRIPFSGPIGGVRIGRVQGHWVLNPTFQQLAFSDMELIVAGSQDSIVMVEGGALEVSEEDVLESLKISRDGIRELIAMQNELLGKSGQVVTVEAQRSFDLFGKNGIKICRHRPDFFLTFKDCHDEVWDAKGQGTPEYRLKRRLFIDNYPQYDYFVVEREASDYA